MVAQAIAEVREERNPIRLRSNPHVLKRAVLRYPPKRHKHENWPQPTKLPAEAVRVIK